MLDSKLLRNSIKTVEQGLKKRGSSVNMSVWTKLEKSRKGLQSYTEERKALLNNLSKKIGHLKANKKKSSKEEKEALALTSEIKDKSSELDEILKEQKDFLLELPNLPDEDVPKGKSEEDNVEVRKWGKIPEFSFKPRDHLELGKMLDGIDMDAASRISGARFSVLKSDLATLHRSLTQFMINTHVLNHGYEELYVPYIVNKESLTGTGQLPKFEEDLFKLRGNQEYYLTSTAEIPVTNMLRGQIVDSKKLPIKWVSHTPCFRSESGSYGKDTRGLMRLHQFEKVELVQAVEASNSEKALEELTNHAEEILKALEIPYRVVMLCGSDLGFSAAKTYDLEAWIPSQNKYREISSCSNFRDFQSRRMLARWKNEEKNNNELLHTLNGSGLAVGRTLLALLENNQLEDGSIKVPKVLEELLGKSKIEVK
ncbi:MAG: serine--tRNA ligase [Gammaproteobacteria bacterium]|nr:serine--tRNA ligase [Gammaproteobacteria bacterium]|tara:strand:- start:3173 stop:4450 length:1278 start_codon:yes stop_codon:yes gene_type:complete